MAGRDRDDLGIYEVHWASIFLQQPGISTKSLSTLTEARCFSIRIDDAIGKH